MGYSLHSHSKCCNEVYPPDSVSFWHTSIARLHAESPVLHAESSCILHAKGFLLYFTWPLIMTLLRVHVNSYILVLPQNPIFWTLILILFYLFNSPKSKYNHTFSGSLYEIKTFNWSHVWLKSWRLKCLRDYICVAPGENDISGVLGAFSFTAETSCPPGNE